MTASAQRRHAVGRSVAEVQSPPRIPGRPGRARCLLDLPRARPSNGRPASRRGIPDALACVRGAGPPPGARPRAPEREAGDDRAIDRDTARGSGLQPLRPSNRLSGRALPRLRRDSPLELHQPGLLRPDPPRSPGAVQAGGRSRRMTEGRPARRRPYSWECAWCKRRYVALDRREPAHVRGFGEYLFCTTYCLEGWQAERVPPPLFARQGGDSRGRDPERPTA
jgi:hypothetical protein